MRQILRKIVYTMLLASVLSWAAEFVPMLNFELISNAEAVVGRPATPVSYAGVARRTTVNRPGNRGGPVNRVGRR